MDKNMASVIAYLGVWVTGIILLLTEKEDEKVRFHAMQSTVAFGALTALTMVPLIGWILSPFIILFSTILWIYCLVKAFQGEMFELPIVGEFSKKQLKRVK